MQMTRQTEWASEDELYPDDDGKPMTDNTRHASLMVYLFENIERMYTSNPLVFVAMNLLWYAVEGRPAERVGPDVLVALGRPKGHRGSYRQWLEEDTPPTVTFEIGSPGNREDDIDDKRRFYDRHGVSEYYHYDPDTHELAVWLRRADGGLRRRRGRCHGFRSPLLGIRFDLSGTELRVMDPHGLPFLTHLELEERRQAAEEQARVERRVSRNARRRAAAAQARAAAAQAEADAERERAAAAQAEADAERQRATAAEGRAVAAEGRADALEELLRRHGIALPGETP